MNRLFIIIAAIAGISGAAWALRHPSNPAPAATEGAATPAAAAKETPSCCQKAPSRASLLAPGKTSLLEGKPAAGVAH